MGREKQTTSLFQGLEPTIPTERTQKLRVALDLPNRAVSRAESGKNPENN